MKRIFTLILIQFLVITAGLVAQNSLGFIQDNTNEALPNSYNFQEYIYAEPDDQGSCLGNENASTVIEGIFMAQTHRHAIDHPLFFTIGYRPALFQVALTGAGLSPDVTVEGMLDNNSLGILCLAGPENLPESIDLTNPGFEEYFSVTLPKAWIQDGLELTVTAGNETRVITSEELKIGPYTEMNLVMVNMDVMDYNNDPHNWPIFEDFLQEMASAIPASVVRFGIFPETLVFPEIIANNDTEELVRLKSRSEMGGNDIFSDGYINSIAAIFTSNLHRSTNDYQSTVYFGNTLNLAPGGWGGGKSFVGFDYTDIFIHELGHALSLPHWGQGSYENPDPNEYEFLYPYGGEDDDGGGRGEAWNFIQDIYEFVSTTCEDDNNGNLGKERSDCMQRNNACIETRSDGSGPWDGYGDFSALAIHRYLMGGEVETGQVTDRQEVKDYQFNMQGGFPIVGLENGKRVYTRDPQQPEEIPFDQQFIMPGEEQINQEVYLIYGTAHETQEQANIVYKPIKFNGTLPPIIDLTDSLTFAEMQQPEYRPHYYGTRDITVKLTYEDGSELHALNPFESYDRAPYNGGFHIWRWDISNFSLTVPADKELLKVQVYKRPFCARGENDDTEGNINYAPHDITANNFMDEAVLLSEFEFGQPQTLGTNTIGNRVWFDENRNGIDDIGERGIADVSLVLWRDGDDDDIPDWMGFAGVEKTDEEGYYSFGGLEPGNYLVFVWSVDNWEEGEPLEGMVPTEIYVDDPNSDINLDNNGRLGSIAWGLTDQDIASGMITLTKDGEPLDDGDIEDCWFDYDSPGNMTIDFGFHFDTPVSTQTVGGTGLYSLAPNPANDAVTVMSRGADAASVQIYDLQGRLVYQKAKFSGSIEIDISDFSSGIYQVVLQNDDNDATILRLVKI